MKNKKVLLGIVAVVLIVAIMAVAYLSTRPETTEGAKTLTVDIVHSDGTSKTVTVNTDAEYVGEALLEEGIVEGEQFDYGLYMSTVDGEEAVYEVDSAYWAFYVNGEYATTGIDVTPIEEGVSYSIEYTIG